MDIHLCIEDGCGRVALGYNRYCFVHGHKEGFQEVEINLNEENRNIDDAYNQDIATHRIETCVICGQNKVIAYEEGMQACKLCSFLQSGENRAGVKFRKDSFLYEYIEFAREERVFNKESYSLFELFLTSRFIEHRESAKFIATTEIYSKDGTGEVLEGHPDYKKKSVDIETSLKNINALTDPEAGILDRGPRTLETVYSQEMDQYTVKILNIQTEIKLVLKNTNPPPFQKGLEKLFREDSEKIFELGELLPFLKKRQKYWDRVPLTQSEILEVMTEYSNSLIK